MIPDMTRLPFSESYWVVSGKLMAGEYPGVNNDDMTRQRIISLLRCGVTSFIDLTKPGDSFHPYKEILNEEAAQFDVAVTWQNFPIVDFSTPTPSQMEGYSGGNRTSCGGRKDRICSLPGRDR